MRIVQRLLVIFFAGRILAFQSDLAGDPADVTRTTSPGIVLMGGGSDVTPAFRWMISKSGGGDFVVIRWGSLGGYTNWIHGLGEVNSVETIAFESRQEASNTTLVNKIRNAEALWIAGGDQGNYVNGWKDTPVEDAINYLINEKKVPVGGTSAGCAIMTPIYWAATSGSWPQNETGPQALTNPFQTGRNGMGFNDFLRPPFLDNVIGDQHYMQRNRQYRHIAMMAHAHSRGHTPIRGIGCNEATAVCIDEKGKAIVYGSTANSYAFFIHQYCGGPEVYQSGQPLTWLGGFKVYKVLGNSQGDRFLDLTNWQTGNGGTWEYWYVDTGELIVASSPIRTCAVPVGEGFPGTDRTLRSKPGEFVAIHDITGRRICSGRNGSNRLPTAAYIARTGTGNLVRTVLRLPAHTAGKR